MKAGKVNHTVKKMTSLIMQYRTPRNSPLPEAWPTLGEAHAAGLDRLDVIGARAAKQAARIILKIRWNA